jgi:soluble P-type ATPase
LFRIIDEGQLIQGDNMFDMISPGFGRVRLMHCVTDFTGTLSVDGKLLPGVREGLNALAKMVTVHVLTADTFGVARAELAGVECEIHILTDENLDVRKEKFVRDLGADSVIAMGNGNNDRLMLKVARLGIAVCLAEGCARDAIDSADILVMSPLDAFALLASPNRLKATLRF